MSRMKTVSQHQRFSVKAGKLSDIMTSTGSLDLVARVSDVTISSGRVRIDSTDQQNSLLEINRRLHSVNLPLKGGDTDDQEVGATSS